MTQPLRPQAFTLIELPKTVSRSAALTTSKGFTLIELLVVITIIVVLLALLTPALDRAVAAAQSAVCMSTLRNWSLAMRQYTMDNKGQTPQTATTMRDYWWSDLSAYMGEPDFPKRKAPLGWMKANICPSAQANLNTGRAVPNGGVAGTPLPTNSSYWGSASKVWQWNDPNANGTAGAYGINLWLMPNEKQQWAPAANYWGRYVNVPGDAVLLGDCIWVGGWPAGDEKPPGDLPPADTENGNASADLGGNWSLGGQMGRWVINRHQLGTMAMNLSFVDGSSRNVRLGELWNLTWHQNFLRSNAYESNYP